MEEGWDKYHSNQPPHPAGKSDTNTSTHIYTYIAHIVSHLKKMLCCQNALKRLHHGIFRRSGSKYFGLTHSLTENYINATFTNEVQIYWHYHWKQCVAYTPLLRECCSGHIWGWRSGYFHRWSWNSNINKTVTCRQLFFLIPHNDLFLLLTAMLRICLPAKHCKVWTRAW